VERRYATYRPAMRRRRRPRVFRSVRLNAVGWTAVVLVGVAGAGVAYGVSRVAGWPGAPAAVVGTLACVAGLVVADRRRWGALEVGYSWGADPAVVSRIGADLQRQGLPVRVDTDAAGRCVLHFRNRDAGRVRSALARAGAPFHR
jgi:hypothetical protein